MTETKKEFLRIINQLESKELKETRISELLDQIVDLFSEHEDEVIALFEELNENQVTWLVPTFEELAFLSQSDDFIFAVENLSQKYPEIPDIREYIEEAKYAMAS